MGRVKLQIKKIENTTNRQVTYSKRRNGLIKKAYELSVLCDVDVALIMFSPSDRISAYSGNNKSIEDIITRYVNLPEQERERLQNQEYLKRALGKLKCESSNRAQHQLPTSPLNDRDSQLEEIQQQYAKCKSQLEEVEQRLRVYECDPSEITTLCEAQYKERIFEHNLNQIRQQKKILEEKFFPIPDTQAPSEVNMGSKAALSNNEFAITTNAIPNEIMNSWLHGGNRDPYPHNIFNFLDSSGLLSLSRDETGIIHHLHHHHEAMDELVAPPMPSLLHLQTASLGEQNVSTVKVENDNVQRSIEFYRQMIDINVSPWTEFTTPAKDVSLTSSYQRDRAILEAFISQLTTPSLNQNHHI